MHEAEVIIIAPLVARTNSVLSVGQMNFYHSSQLPRNLSIISKLLSSFPPVTP